MLMPPLEINFKATHTELETRYRALLEQKFNSLEKFIGSESDVNCTVEFEKITNQSAGKLYRVEANLYLAGKLYRVEATEDNFEKAISRVRDELEKRLRRAVGKRESLLRLGHRKIKNMLRFGSDEDS